MFQFGRCPPPCLFDSARGATPYRVAGCPIRRSSDYSLVPAPRRLSQLPTSFFGTRRQGIHRMLVVPSSSVPRLSKHAFLRPCLRIRFPSSWAWANSVKYQAHSSKQISSSQPSVSSTVHVAAVGVFLTRSRTRRDVSSVVKVHIHLSLQSEPEEGTRMLPHPNAWCLHTPVVQQAAC
jgi:hypothetical protein